jgi:glycosyltransferase involved in cell wall biosynthesis
MTHETRIAIVRPIGIPISRDFYNSQEIGLARGLSICGISVDVFVAGRGPGVQCQNIPAGGSGIVRLFEVPFFTLPEIRQAIYPQLRRLLEDGRYDLIQVNEENEITSFLAASLAKRKSIPVVVYQGMYERIMGRIIHTYQRCYDAIVLPRFRKNIDLALAKTTRAKAHLEHKGFTKTLILPVGLDPAPFAERTDRNWRNELSIQEKNPIILYVGIFEKRRNVDFMLDLAKQLAPDGITFVMAGKGPEYARITERAKNEKISNVRLVGKVPQSALPSLYRESALFLLPSNYEIYGMVMLEAMYFGVPVISTCTAGPEDVINNEIDGLLIYSLDIGLWADAIRRLALQPKKLAAMSEAARQKIQNKLTWEVIARDYASKVVQPLRRNGRNN